MKSVARSAMLKGMGDFCIFSWTSSTYVEAMHVCCLGWSQVSPLKTFAELLCLVLCL